MENVIQNLEGVAMLCSFNNQTKWPKCDTFKEALKPTKINGLPMNQHVIMRPDSKKDATLELWSMSETML